MNPINELWSRLYLLLNPNEPSLEDLESNEASDSQGSSETSGSNKSIESSSSGEQIDSSTKKLDLVIANKT